jgi:hypothetical protein
LTEQTETDTITCAVCERRLLPGERANPYVSREGTEVSVCELCKSRAESAGWLRPEQVEPGAGATEGRGSRRQRGELLSGLRNRVERERSERRRRREEKAAADEEARAGEAASEPAEPAPAERKPKPAPEPSKVRHGGVGGLGPAEVLAAFNESEHRRTIAGLSRSLGAPRATAIAIRTSSGHPGARITIAWDLAWYQWEVGPGKRGPEIRQISKGETIDQLRASDRNWNLEVGEDGALSRRKASAR